MAHIYRRIPRLLSSLHSICNVKIFSSAYHSRPYPFDNEKYVAGSHIDGFTVEKITPIPEFDLSAVELKHAITGAQYIHLARQDTNNVFCVSFKTTPMDDTGVPHILEHTVLCGSQKYPCRDPFFKMLNRSLSTFMNAFTSCDYTMYPFSTQNEQDFKNLMSVYCDAVFFPHLSESDFRQEGWRLEHEDVNDGKSPIVFKGVVFNEMKGYFVCVHCPILLVGCAKCRPSAVFFKYFIM
jgi:Zn-dependent M16 (insulinase) family peptidase